jgi:hypothetical protein
MKAYHFAEERKLVIVRFGSFQHPTDPASKAAMIEVNTFIHALAGRRAYTFDSIPGEWFLMATQAALAEPAQNDIPAVAIGPKGEQITTFDPSKNYFNQPLKKGITLVDENGFFDRLAEIDPTGSQIRATADVFKGLKDPVNVRQEVSKRVDKQKKAT